MKNRPGMLSLEYSHTIYPYNSEDKDVYELLGYDYSFTKDTEKNGEVKSCVRGGVVTLVLATSPTDNLFSWFLNGNKLASGEIILGYGSSQTSSLLKFERARCNGFRLRCQTQKDPPELVLTVTASKIRIGNVEFGNPGGETI